MKPIVLGLGDSSSNRRPDSAVPAPTEARAAAVRAVAAPSGGSPILAGVSSASAAPAAPSAAGESEFLPALKQRVAAFLTDLQDPGQRTVLVTIAVLVGLLVYSYFPALAMAFVAWQNPQYAHGWIVPLFSAALLFWWRQPVSLPVPFWARVAGLSLLGVSFGLRLFVASYRIVTIDMYTFVPAMVGVFLLAGGWSLLRWAWSPLVFLIFMFPLPDEATRYLLGPLQTIATIVSTFALQTLGLEAYREGNQIILGEMHLGVVDACSGLRMLTIFCALAVGMVMVGQRSWWENSIILASAIPIALIVNAIRITVTGLLFQVADSEFAERVFHDWAGMVMMPMAMLMLYMEQYLLSNIFLPESEGPSVLAGRGGAATIAPVGPMGARVAAAPSSAAAAPRPTVGRKGSDGPIVGFPPRGG